MGTTADAEDIYYDLRGSTIKEVSYVLLPGVPEAFQGRGGGESHERGIEGGEGELHERGILLFSVIIIPMFILVQLRR